MFWDFHYTRNCQIDESRNKQTVRPKAFRKHAATIMSLSFCHPGRIYWRPCVRSVMCWHCTVLLNSCCRMCRDQSTDGISLVHSFPTFCDRASVLCHWIQTVSDQRGTFHKVCCYRNGYRTGTCQVIYIEPSNLDFRWHKLICVGANLILIFRGMDKGWGHVRTEYSQHNSYNLMTEVGVKTWLFDCRIV